MGGQKNIVINNKNGIPTYFHDASEPVISKISEGTFGGLLRTALRADVTIAESRASLLPAVTDYLTRTMGDPLVNQPDPAQERLDRQHKREIERAEIDLKKGEFRLRQDEMRLLERRFENDRLNRPVVMADLYGRKESTGYEESSYPRDIPRDQGQGEKAQSSGKLSEADGEQYKRYFGRR